MKKLLLITTAAAILASTAAQADVSFAIGVNEPAYPPAYPVYAPGYVVAPDWPSYHYDRHRHWHNEYWAHRMPRHDDDRDYDHDHGHDWHH